MDKHPLDWNAKLVRFFLYNSRLVWLLILMFLVGGVVSLASFQRQGFPQVSPATIVVQTIYAGAPAGEVESKVTQPIVSAVKDVKGLKDTSSTSANSLSMVVLQLDQSTNLDQAVQDAQSKIQSIRGKLPSDIENPNVTTFSTGGDSFDLGVTQNTANPDLNQIRNEAKKITDQLRQVPGIKSAEVVNERQDRIFVQYRVADLTRNNIPLATITQALQAANLDLPAGQLTLNDSEQSILVQGSFSSIDDIKQLIVGVNPLTHQPIHLQDVATVTSGLDNQEVIERFGYTHDGKTESVPGVMIAVNTTKSSDIIKVRSAMQAKLDDLKTNGTLDKETVVTTLLDQGQSTQQQVNEIVGAAIGERSNFYLLGGIQLLFLAMLAFVNFQAAIIAALAIPLSLGFSFIVLHLMGVQLNTIVLFSLILLLGLIVDPAIVMIEAIQHYKEIGLDGKTAVIESGRRYGASLFMAVLTSLIVFVPFGVVGGIFGQIIKYIPLTVIPALVASYLVPMAILPLLASRFLKTKPRIHTAPAAEHEELSKAAEFVMSVNRWALQNTWRALGILVFCFVLVGLSLALVATGKVHIVQFTTPQDNPELTVAASFAPGVPLAQRSATAQAVENAIASEPGVDHFLFASQSDTSVNYYVELKDKAQRKDANLKSKAVLAHLQDKLSGLTDYSVHELSVGPPESDYQIQTQIYADNPTDLEAGAKDIGHFLSQTNHVVKVDDGFTGKDVPQVTIALDRSKVEQLGLTNAEVALQIKSLTDQTQVTKLDNPTTNQSTDVYLVNSSTPSTLDGIKNLPLVTHNGQVIKVSDVANVQETNAVTAIQKFDSKQFVNIRARLDNANNTIEVQNKLNNYLTPQKLSQLHLSGRDNRGDTDDIAQSFKQLGIALAVAVLLTYLVLVLQFKSFSQPGIMLFTIPLSLIGVFPALYLSHSDLGFLELLGVTILVGIVENVAIFLIDYANQLVREQGMTPKEAIIQASGVRFRPIILTKLVALGGLLPLAIESDFWRGLSLVIIAGIGLSGFFSLVVIPILYVRINSLRRRIHKRQVI